MWSSDDELEVPDLEGKSTTTTHDTPSQSLQAPLLQFLLIFLAKCLQNIQCSSDNRFIKFFIHAVGQAFDDTSIIRLGSAVPLTHEKMHKLLGFDTENWCTELLGMSELSLHI